MKNDRLIDKTHTCTQAHILGYGLCCSLPYRTYEITYYERSPQAVLFSILNMTQVKDI